MDFSQASFLRHFTRIRSTSSSGSTTENQLGPSFAGRRVWSISGADFSTSDSSSTSFHPPGRLIMDGSLPTNLISSANIMRNLSTSSSMLSPGRGSEEGQSSSDSHQQNTRSSKVPKICGVCGDRAKSFHFGGLACDSCKAFFRRSVHNDAYTAFRCAYDGCCHITKNTRKGCQNCRFEKCLSIGMEKNWVMSEQERNIFNQQRMKKKKGPVTEGEEPSTTSPSKSSSVLEYAGVTSGGDSHHRISQRKQKAYEPELGNMIQFMTDEDQTCIKKVVEDYRRAYIKIPYRVPQETDGPRNSVQIIEMFTTILRRFAYFCKLVPEFQSLSKDDQGKLLRESVLEMCLLRGALSFDAQNHRWPNTNMEFLKDCPQLKFDDVENLVDPELHMMHMSFIQKMQKLKVDEPTMMLLLMVVLFYADTVVSDQKAVMDAESKYLSLLEKYVHWRYGPKRGPRLYPHLLSKMVDLQHLNDVHTAFELKLATDDIKVINEDLAKLKIDENEPTGADSSPEIVFVRDTGSSDDDVQLIESPVSQSKTSATAATAATARNPEFANAINTSLILEHTTGQPKNTASPPPRSPRHIKQRLQNADTQRSLHKRQCAKNPMAEVFLRRIPALIEDPFAPMVTESEILRFKEVLSSGAMASSAGHFQLPPGFDPSSLLSRFPQRPSSPSDTQTHHPPFTFPGSRNEDLSPTHANLIAAANPLASHLGGFQIPSPMGRPNVPTGSLMSINLPPHELEIARRIQDSLSPEKRAELRAMFFPNEVTAAPPSSASNVGNFGFGGGSGLHLSPQHLQSFITRACPSTSSPMTSVAAGHHYGGGVCDADLSSPTHHQSPMRMPMPSGGPPPVSPGSLMNVQTPTVLTSGSGTLASSPSNYQIHPHLRVGDPSVKKPQFNWK